MDETLFIHQGYTGCRIGQSRTNIVNNNGNEKALPYFVRID